MADLGTIQQEALGKFKGRRRLTIKRIAEETGWSRPYVSQVFSGARRVPENFIDDLNARYGLQPDEREELRLAIRSTEKRLDLSRFAPKERVIISTLAKEIEGLGDARQEELLTLIKAFLKLDRDEVQAMLGEIPLEKLSDTRWKYFDAGTGHDKRFGLGVKPKKFKELWREADQFRAKFGLAPGETFPVIKLIDQIGAIVPGATFETVERFKCEKTKGFTDVGKKCVVVSNEVYRASKVGGVSSEWVIAHELGHLWLHGRDDVFDIEGVGFTDAERQANMFAAMIKAPVSMFQAGDNVIDLAAKGRVPMLWARELFMNYGRNYNRRNKVN